MVVTTLSWAYGHFGSPALRVAWIASGVVGVLYAFYWDIVNDWGLLEGVDIWGAVRRGDLSSAIRREEGGVVGRRTLLRRKTLYPAPLYVWAAASNLVLRCLWIVSISSSTVSDSVPEAYAARFALGLGEVYRRVQWNLFRVENEHLNNCGQFRVVNQRRFMQLRMDDDEKVDHDEDDDDYDARDGVPDGLEIIRAAQDAESGSGFGRSSDDSGTETPNLRDLRIGAGASSALTSSERARSRYSHVEKVRDSFGVEMTEMGGGDGSSSSSRRDSSNSGSRRESNNSASSSNGAGASASSAPNVIVPT
jgi:hypothetical protein